jgi:hypothetical protein
LGILTPKTLKPGITFLATDFFLILKRKVNGPGNFST